jgi:hypothetical protein
MELVLLSGLLASLVYFKNREQLNYDTNDSSINLGTGYGNRAVPFLNKTN